MEPKREENCTMRSSINFNYIWSLQIKKWTIRVAEEIRKGYGILSQN
jgi:hypothetical protein